MRIFKLITILFFVTFNSFATPTKLEPVMLNPTTLRNLFLARNVDIAIAMNDVQQAKAQVAQARGNLLPGINLGSVISSGPSFMLTSVSVLLPFLMPSKWLDLRESTHLLNAQSTSYYLAQLNGYASAYAIYITVLGDVELREALYKQYLNFKDMEDRLKLPAEVGIISKEEYLQAQAQTKMALVQVSQLDELILREKASIRHMLGLDLNQEIFFEKSAIATSPIETLTPQEVLDKVNASSPEVAQINSLITAAEVAKWSKAFSFLSGSSLSSNRSANGGAFSSVTQTGSVNFGFGYFPSLEISNLNIEQLKLRKKELKLDQAELIESTLGSLKEAQIQYQAAAQAEDNLRQVYEAEVKRYQVGISNMTDVLVAANAMTGSVVNKVKAATALNTLRISLHRVMISDQFANVEKCEIQRKSSGGIRGRLGRIFNPNKDKATLDEICGN